MATDKKNIEAIYPLSPMQQAVLVDSLMPGVDNGYLQLECSIEGDINEDRLRRAWQHVLNAHAVLRTTIHWKDLEEPLQIVRKKLELPWMLEDLSERSPADQDRIVSEYRQLDRALGLDLDKAPTFRVAFFRTGATSGRLVWSCHHALIDGWSGSLIIQGVVRAYESLGERVDPPRLAPRDYRHYVRWLASQDPAKQERFWRVHLDGVTGVTTLPFLSRTNGVKGKVPFERVEAHFDESTTANLRAYCRRHRITTATLYQAVWALVLSAASSSSRQVVFGATVSGRDIDLQGVEEMVGLFINTIPVKAEVNGAESFADFARRMQTEQTAARRFAYVPPDRIQEAADLPPHERLYDSLVVVENFPPIKRDASSTGRGIAVSGFSGGITTNYALTLVVGPSETTELHLIFDPRRLSASTAEVVLGFVVTVAEGLADGAVDVGRAGDAEEGDPSIAVLRKTLDLDTLVRKEPSSSGGPTQQAEPSAAASAAPGHVEPRTDTERRIASLWRRLVGNERVGVNDNFFDVGGQSVLALRLLKELDAEFGIRIPVATLFDSPTIEHIASVITGEHPDDVSTVVAMQPDGNGIPVVCVHSWSGDTIMYRGIAATIGDAHPVYGLQAPGLDGTSEILDSIEDLADHHVRAILERWPDEPVALVGRCLSGPLILEMADRIEEAGGRVAAVINLDSGRPRGLPPRILARYTGEDDPNPPPVAKDLAYYRKRFERMRRELGLLGMIKDQVMRNVVGGVLRRVFGGVFGGLIRRVNPLWRAEPANEHASANNGAATSVDMSADTADGPGDDPVPEELGVLDDPRVAAVVEGLSRAWLRYEQRPYNGELILIRSTESASKSGKDWHISHWERYVQAVRVHVVEGRHQTMLLEPEVAGVTRVIKMTLETTEMQESAR